jgi:DNA mismatch endonuclease, patch repair protein
MKNEERSRIMRAVRSTDTRPELLVRKIIHRLGYRFRLHRKDLAGTPDIVFPARRKLIFVHGCFWHGHTCKRGARLPKTNRVYWTKKIRRNTARDEEHLLRLKASGWRVMTIWECALKNKVSLSHRIERFLGPGKSSK